MGSGSSTKVLRAPRQRKPRQQVAAVCYRIGRCGIEFLLVQTRGGRWIFPKGGLEPRHTRAQSAALEAFEEAGVHGRIEEVPFARYYRSAPNAAVSEPGVTAYLCEVIRREAPQEANRKPTWFSAEKARQRLRQDRSPDFGRELSRVVERACSRIERLQCGAPGSRSFEHKEELQKVRFDYLEAGRFHDGQTQAALVRHVLQRHPALETQLRSVPGIGTKEIGGRVLRLSAGADSSPELVRTVTAIDRGLAAGMANRGNLSRAKRRNARRPRIP
ncbi:MAG: NUDIX domain-containing protein [Terriglobales bacterium]